MVGIAWLPMLMNLIGGMGGGQTGGPMASQGQGPGPNPLAGLVGASNYQQGTSRGPMADQGTPIPVPGPQASNYQPVSSGGGNKLGALAGMLGKGGSRGVPDPNWLQNSMNKQMGGSGGGDIIFLPPELSKKQQRMQAAAHNFRRFRPMAKG